MGILPDFLQLMMWEKVLFDFSIIWFYISGIFVLFFLFKNNVVAKCNCFSTWKSLLTWYYFIADMPREKVPQRARKKERTVRNNSKERIVEELSNPSTKPSLCGLTFFLPLCLPVLIVWKVFFITCRRDSCFFEDFFLLPDARLCLTCRSIGLILVVKPNPAMINV